MNQSFVYICNCQWTKYATSCSCQTLVASIWHRADKPKIKKTLTRKKKSRCNKHIDRTNYGQYTPNEVNPFLRLGYLAFSVFVIFIGINGLINDDLYISTGHRPGMHFSGNASIIMFFALTCLVLNLISFVVDHYDKRRNERHYKFFRKLTEIVGYVAFVLAIIIQIVQSTKWI